MEKIRIGFLVDGGEGGGTAQYTNLLVRNLDRNIFRIYGFFSGSGNSLTLLGPVFDEVVILGDKRLINIGYTVNKHWRWWVNVKKGIRGILYSVRLTRMLKRNRIQCLSINYFPHHILGGIAAKVAGIPSVWHWHAASSFGKTKSLVLKITAKYFCNRIIAISRFVRNNLPVEMQRKSVVIYNGVDVSSVENEQQKNHLRNQFSISSREKIVIMVGNIVKLKGHEYFIKAAIEVVSKIECVRFLIIGHEPQASAVREHELDRLNAIVEEYNCGKFILFTGQLPNVWRYFSDCSILCMPTVSYGNALGEGFGLALAEAMAAGIAVISSDAGAFEEIITHGENGLIVPQKNISALAGAITRLLSDEKLRKKMAESGKQTVKAKFSIERMISETSTLYKEIRRKW